MFGKSEQKKQVLPDIKITKIPDDFYAGMNPIIKFKTSENESKPVQAGKPVLSLTDKKNLDKKTAVGAGNKLHLINLISNWKFLIIAGLAVLVVCGLIGGLYYWWQYNKTLSVAPEPVQPVITEPINITPVVSETISTSTVEPEPVVTALSVQNGIRLEFPSLLLGSNLDTDSDDITDIAEELYSTDPAVSDTDGDKFPDGHEIYYLYNPAGKEPMKLIDSGLVDLYTNPIFLYKLYYPKTWAVGNVDTSYKDILFSTITGENIEVKVMDVNPGETFDSWFANNAMGEQLADYLPFDSVFKETGFVRKDNLVYFFPKGNQVFVVLYHTTDSNVTNYQIVIKMMARSFQFGNSTDIPVRPVEESTVVPL
ncbi:MAG: hypothetical protein WCV83_02910 [Candidatus Magasanikbacteria bacterium]|jgi:hypothetical protein